MVSGMPALLSDVELFARLVAMDTTSYRSNLVMVEWLCGYLERPGVRLTRFPSDDCTKANLLAEIGPAVAADRRGLVLSAHMDVVPAGEGWSAEPFVLTDRGDRWLGRGTADMKGFLALAVNSFARARGEELRAPLALLLTYDEELGCLGAEHLAKTWPPERRLPRAVVIGEPTSLRAVRLHKGHLKLRLDFRGVSAHSGYPHLGVNAIEPAGRAIVALATLRQELEREHHALGEHFPETPFIALNVARVRGGEALNVVPDHCTVEIGLRLLPGDTPEPLVERVSRAVEAAIPGTPFELATTGFSPPLLLAETAPIYRTAREILGQHETVSASYGTDGGWLQRLDLDCVILGPGSIEVAHKPDEWIAKDEFLQGAELVERLITRCCREESHA